MEGKYKGANENFITMLYRYNIVMNVLNYSQEIHPQKLKDGKFVNMLRKLPYTEAVERLIVLFAYGVIDENALHFLTIKQPLNLESAVLAENKVIDNEKNIQSGIDSDKDIIIENKRIEDILKICAVSHNTEYLTETDFLFLYNNLERCSGHIKVDDGYCYPSYPLLKFLNEYENTLVICDKDSGQCEPVDKEIEVDTYSLSEFNDELENTVPIIKDVTAAVTYALYLNRFCGKDFLRYSIQNNIPINSDQYDDYIKEKKLCFDFIAYKKRRNICGTNINHFDYDDIETNEGRIIKQESVPDKEFSYKCQLDLSEVDNDNSQQLITKALKKFTNKMPPCDLVVQTVLDEEPVMYIFSGAKCEFIKINYDEFRRDLFDYEKVLSFVNVCSEKHLIRTTADDNVQILLVKGNQNYAEIYEMNDNELAAAKNVIREQFEKRKIIDRRRTAELRNMTQLKVEAEQMIKMSEENKRIKQQERADKQAKRDERKKNDATE